MQEVADILPTQCSKVGHIYIFELIARILTHLVLKYELNDSIGPVLKVSFTRGNLFFEKTCGPQTHRRIFGSIGNPNLYVLEKVDLVL